MKILNKLLFVIYLLGTSLLHAQEFQASAPISAIDESGNRVFTTDNVKVYGSF